MINTNDFVIENGILKNIKALKKMLRFLTV